MGFLNRFATLLRADAHGMVDALEDQALMLRQHLRDAQAELARKRFRLEALAAEDKDLEGEAARVRERSAAFDQDVALALQSGKDDLARYAVRQLLPLRQGLDEIARRREAIGDERAELQAQLADQEVAYRQLEQRVRGHLAQLESDPSAVPFSAVVTDEDVELELLRRRRGEAGEVGLGEGGAP